LIQQNKKSSVPDKNVTGMFEAVLGCKWSLTVLDLIGRGINRPGAMERTVEGLTAKVLNERLRKLCRFGILTKQSYPEVPPRVEYALTDFGTKFLVILDQIRALGVTRGTQTTKTSKRSGRHRAA